MDNLNNLNAQISQQMLELDQKKFTLALVKNGEENYEQFTKSLEEEKKSKAEILESFQQQVFDNRIHFSDELISFAISDTTTILTSAEVIEYIPAIPAIPNDLKLLADDFEQPDGVEWNINLPEFAFRNEDDKMFEEIQFRDENRSGAQKGKFIFKERKVSK